MKYTEYNAESTYEKLALKRGAYPVSISQKIQDNRSRSEDTFLLPKPLIIILIGYLYVDSQYQDISRTYFVHYLHCSTFHYHVTSSTAKFLSLILSCLEISTMFMTI